MSLKPGQIKCINTLDEPLVVAAGAGSGKTFTLTKRIVNALESGYVDDIDQVLAITFTKKAAGELKSRVKSSLRAAGLVDQALKVDEAWISTIHGMCARILRAHAVQLGIDPAFSVADDASLRGMRAQAIETALDEFRAEAPEALAALFAEYRSSASGGAGQSFGGVSVQGMLDALVAKMAALPDGADAVAVLPKAMEPVLALSEFSATMELLIGWAEQQKDSASKDDFVAAAADALARAQAAMEAGSVDAQTVLGIMATAPASCRFGAKDFKSAVKSAVSDLRAYAFAVRLSAAQPYLETMLALARRATQLFAEAKLAAGLLSNDDLLLGASKAIAEHPDIAARYEDKFKLIMVDEFQDTDQMQVDMIKRLAGPGACRLCVVGDAQQSIYRFRGADVSVYRKHLAQVRRGNADNIVYLPDNFRSHRDILSFVDRIFERDAMFGAEFMSLAPSRNEEEVKRPYKSDGPRIFVQHVSYPTRGGKDVMREASARAIAKRFAELAQKGHSAGDMVILLGTMTNAAVYARAVRDVGLPCVIAGGSVLKSTPEAALLVAFAQWLADPRRTEQLFNILTSPLFGLGPTDLLELATRESQDGVYRRRDLDAGLAAFARDVARNERLQTGASPELAVAAAVLSRALSRVGVVPVAKIIGCALVESGWISRMQQKGETGRASVANAYKLLRILDDQEKSFSLGAAELACRFADVVAHAVEAPGALSVSGGDFVRIMTMHASKGLEFPIVAVAEMKQSSAHSQRLMLDVVDGRLYASLDLGNSADALSGVAKADPKTLDSLLGDDLVEDEIPAKMAVCEDALELRAEMCARAVMGDAEEAKRLLYVALTRAKEALVVATFGNRTKANPNGAPGNAFASVGPALTGGDDWFAPGESYFDFGGERRAYVEHIELNADSDEATDAPAGAVSSAAQTPSAVQAPSCSSANGESAEGSFAVPELALPSKASDVAADDAHAGIFSYSSVADASHEGDLLEDLAARFACRAAATGDAANVPLPEVPASTWLGDAAASDWLSQDEPPSDDKATDFGTAFHRLAQYAVRTRRGGALEFPPSARIEALVRASRLGAAGAARLRSALERWFSSNLAAGIAKKETLLAEVPFFVEIPAGESFVDQVFLEGEIDLLAFDAPNGGFDGATAYVVDYKTGGSPTEGAHQLDLKHVLQAACYAYALICQGFAAVEASFVRVEQPSAADSRQPQVVSYRFSADDKPIIEEAIRRAYRQAYPSPKR